MNKKATKTGNTPKESRYFSRDLSWVEFNARVLEQALNTKNPLLERLKFLAIVSSNFDEFFMVRMAGWKRLQASGDETPCPAGITPTETLKRAAKRMHELIAAQADCFADVSASLAKSGLVLLRGDAYNSDQNRAAKEIFDRHVFPLLTPIAIVDGRQAWTANLQSYLLFRLASESGDEKKLALVPMPANAGRFHELPGDEGTTVLGFLEDLIVRSAGRLFPGYRVDAHVVFRVTRDADMRVDEERDDDFVSAMADVVRERQFGSPVRLQIAGDDPELRRILVERHRVPADDVYESSAPIEMKALFGVLGVKGFTELRDRNWKPQPSVQLPEDADVFETLRDRDVFLHHPYDSFDPVIRFISDAADDADTVAIKITLYRTSGKSPIVAALKRAVAAGKQVTALVELKARFDESQNIQWARELETAGVIVIYGLAELKVHSKAALVIRREGRTIRRYAHFGTGNYNEKTAAIYTDAGLLTAREDLTYESALFFNSITGYSAVHGLSKLVMAPTGMRNKFSELVRREIARSTSIEPGLIVAKMNSLVDEGIMELLYEASQAGVQVLLNVRGLCGIRPGVKGLSENIRVVSIIDRFLEHTRMYYFKNGDADELYLSSGDWMPRNIDRRVELMFPLEDRTLKDEALKILHSFFLDNVSSWELQSDGTWDRLKPGKGEKPYRVQEEMCKEALTRQRRRSDHQIRELVVRRRPAE